MNGDSKTFRLVFSALMVAIGTVLSLFSFSGFWVYGGSVTFCSMLPLVIVSYRYGWKWGVFTSLVYGLSADGAGHAKRHVRSQLVHGAGDRAARLYCSLGVIGFSSGV